MVSTRKRIIGTLVPVVLCLPVAGLLLWLGSGVYPEEPNMLGYLVGMLAWNLIPYILLALVLALVKHPPWLWWTALVYSILAGLTGIALIALIILDDSSTATLGILTLPGWLLAGLIPATAIGWAAHRVRATGPPGR